MTTPGDKMLSALPATRAELLEKFPMSKSTMHKWISRLRANKQMHIGKYRRTLGDQAAVFVLGPGKDAKRLKPRTVAQCTKRYRDSLRDLGLYEDELAARRKRHRASKPAHVPPADPLMQWLFKL